MNEKNEIHLAEAIVLLTNELTSLRHDKTKLILDRIDRMETKIMSAISDYVAKQKAFNDRQTAAIDKLGVSLEGITGDVKTLNDKITELQNSTGGVTPEDQALIDEIEAQGEAVATKLETAAAAFEVVDSQTAPAVPPVT